MDARTYNPLAIATLVLAKVFGIVGLVVGGMGLRGIGGLLLGLDGVLLLAAFVLAVRAMKSQTREEAREKDALAKMVREGTLAQYLKDIQAESEPPA